MSIKLLNIQGLTQVKAIEIERILTKKQYNFFDRNSTKIGKDKFQSGHKIHYFNA